MTAAPAPLAGGCHCDALAVTLSARPDPEDLHPRACDCAFCTKHGAAWVSDPLGRLTIDVRDRARLSEYRQGSGSARFLLCRDCGVLVAVVHDGDDGLRGAVNARCLDAAPRFGEPVSVAPQTLSREEKVARWSHLWTPAELRVTDERPG